MPTESVTPRRWSSFVCPVCRLVFRVPSRHEGQGVVCPSCRLLLRLPQDGELPTLSDEIKQSPSKIRDSVVEDGDSANRVLMSTASFIKWGVGLLTLLVLSTWGLVSLLEHRAESEIASSATKQAEGTSLRFTKVENTGEQEDLTKMDSLQLSGRMKEVARAFLLAKTEEDALRHVWMPERVKPLWQQMLAGASYESPGYSGMEDGTITMEGGVISATVTTGDFSSRVMSFHISSDALKVDWESWVGWSEMGGKEFMSKRPTRPTLFRVILSKASYYNFDFSDESKWVSYRLESLDGELSLYGYAPANSALNSQIRPSDEGERKQLVVKLRYLDNSQSKNQVLIDSLVSEGWVEKSSK